MNEKTITIMAAIEIALVAAILVVGCMIYVEVKHDPYDVNGDGVANIVDLSVLAAEVNERGK